MSEPTRIIQLTFRDYFDRFDVDYPRGIALHPLPWGQLWRYVSDSFLNGFINYVQVRRAFLLSRYRRWNDPSERGTKAEMFALATQPDSFVHTDLALFEDDILILGSITGPDDRPVPGRWMYFWFDRDVSDCCVGRFVTQDDDATVLERFRRHCEAIGLEMSQSYLGQAEPARELPLHFFQGWISS
jgi:hypothetical protein